MICTKLAEGLTNVRDSVVIRIMTTRTNKQNIAALFVSVTKKDDGCKLIY